MVALHVKRFKCRAPAAGAVIWDCSTQIMSPKVGNASVVLPSTARELALLCCS